MKKVKKPKQTENEVRIALKYANSIIATLREPFLVINKNLRVVSVNSSFYTTFKVSEKETTGKLLPNLGNGQWNIPKLIHLLKEILPQKMVVTNYEIEHEFKTIGYRIMNLNACQLRIPKKIATLITTAIEEEEEEEEELILLAIEDITEMRRMQENLQRLEKLAAIGKLAGIMGHEIRNPLGVIRNSIYFLNMKLKESLDEKVKRHMDILETEIDGCDKIISDVLEFARTKPPSFTTEEINNVVQEVLSKSNIPKTIKVQTDLGKNFSKLNIDIAQIKQVFSNIISNAIEAMPKGGELSVTISQTDSFISIAFKDTGVGIPKENIDKLFTPLFSTKTKGLGLGLAACQNIISAHQGKIEFESNEGQGATFIIKLPITKKVDTGQEKLKE